MDNDRPILQCPNYLCQALNPEGHKFCHKCRTPLPKLFLWAVGLEGYRLGEVLGDRYLVKADQILLDTKPGLPLEMPGEPPRHWESYLRLFPYRLHVPQIHGWVCEKGRSNSPILLLEGAPIFQ
ncbi:MAG: zinc ribbon domain-containing protein [Leptolyngbyaceae cyanobacterium CSU_1_3]|nr:zinc ribbon domain-containing protein [Leptolyngbyaceae cyanobacterium CSU_1_3]